MPPASALSEHLSERFLAATPDASLAIIFPGQGSHQVGAGRDLHDAFPLAKEVFQRSEQVLGFSLSKLCFEGPEDALRDTANAQPAILAASLACLAAALEDGALQHRPAFTAGHSLGEFSALVAAGALGLPARLLGKPPQVAVRVRAAPELVQALAAERAVSRVPPDEVRDRGRPSQDEAERQQDDG